VALVVVKVPNRARKTAVAVKTPVKLLVQKKSSLIVIIAEETLTCMMKPTILFLVMNAEKLRVAVINAIILKTRKKHGKNSLVENVLLKPLKPARLVRVERCDPQQPCVMGLGFTHTKKTEYQWTMIIKRCEN